MLQDFKQKSTLTQTVCWLQEPASRAAGFGGSCVYAMNTIFTVLQVKQQQPAGFLL